MNKKIIIGFAITAVILLLIIWYRNYQKNKDIAEAKTKLGLPNKSGSLSSGLSDIGKTAIVNKIGTKFYSTDGNFTVGYTKYILGEFAGIIVADKTDSGDSRYYKISNTTGQKLYVLKTDVSVI